MDKCESCVARVTQMLSNAETYDVCALYQYPCDMMTKCDYYIVKADVQPVKHGRWECVGHDDTTYWYRCSVCEHEEHDNMTKHNNYCSSCGARMDDDAK